MISQEFIQKIKQRLKSEKEEVEIKIEKLSKFAFQVDNPDKDDIGEQATEQLTNEALIVTHRDVLSKINVALEKIQNGEYGQCEKCNTEISEDELEKLSWAEHCSKCTN